MTRTILRATLIASVLAFGGGTALAQFGFIFGDPPPRPPGEVPGGGGPGGRQQPMPAPPKQYPPPPQYPTQQQPGGAVQTRPLPAPGAAPPPRGPAVAAPPKGPRQDPVPPPPDEVATTPSQRIEHPTAHFSGLDKITGRIINFPVEIGETVQFGALQLTTRACYTRPPTETANTDAFVEVDEVTLQGEVKRIFTGWMFASSPGLHAVEHPIYDLWLTDCRGGSQVVAADGSAVGTTPQQQPQQKAQPKQKQVEQKQKRPPPQQLPPPQNYPPFR